MSALGWGVVISSLGYRVRRGKSRQGISLRATVKNIAKETMKVLSGLLRQLFLRCIQQPSYGSVDVLNVSWMIDAFGGILQAVQLIGIKLCWEVLIGGITLNQEAIAWNLSKNP
jgi:hypothetical protein